MSESIGDPEKAIVRSTEVNVSADDAAVARDPYRILGLHPGASLGECKREWHRLSILLHDELIEPKVPLFFQEPVKADEETDDIGERIGRLAIKGCLKEILAVTGTPEEADYWAGFDEKSRIQMRATLQDEALCAEVRKDMVRGKMIRASTKAAKEHAEAKLKLINAAWAMIKSAHKPSELAEIDGYPVEDITVVNKVPEFIGTGDVEEQTIFRGIQLDASGVIVCINNGRRVVYPAGSFEASMNERLEKREPASGPHMLYFDFGKQRGWDSYGARYYRQAVSVRSLFAYIDFTQGKQISTILLKDIIQKFGLTQAQVDVLCKTLWSGRDAVERINIDHRKIEKYMYEHEEWDDMTAIATQIAINIVEADSSSPFSADDKERRSRVDFFRRGLLTIIDFQITDSEGEKLRGDFGKVEVSMNGDGAMTIKYLDLDKGIRRDKAKNYKVITLSPSDVNLLITLAYGHVLKSALKITPKSLAGGLGESVSLPPSGITDVTKLLLLEVLRRMGIFTIDRR